jgi:transketolase
MPNLNVKIAASHGGVITGEDGASAQALEDLALMLALPTFRVVVPADVVECAQAIEEAARRYGPFYIRMGRPKIPIIYDERYRFQLGKAHMLRPGGDVTVVAAGDMVFQALEAARLLAQEGIEARVLNMASLRPLDEEAIVAAAQETGAILVAEDHSVHGGLGSLVAQVVARTCPVPMAFVGMTTFGTSGRWDQLLEHFGLAPPRIAAEARELVARKRA